jgi:hypothetical protein
MVAFILVTLLDLIGLLMEIYSDNLSMRFGTTNIINFPADYLPKDLIFLIRRI